MNNDISINGYIEQILPEKELSDFRRITGDVRENEACDYRYQKAIEKFIFNLSQNVKERIINTLRTYCSGKFQLNLHSLARIIGRYGRMSLELTLTRVWSAICVAKRQIQKAQKGLWKHKRPERASAEDITVVFDAKSNTLITLYQCGLA